SRAPPPPPPPRRRADPRALLGDRSSLRARRRACAPSLRSRAVRARRGRGAPPPPRRPPATRSRNARLGPRQIDDVEPSHHSRAHLRAARPLARRALSRFVCCERAHEVGREGPKTERGLDSKRRRVSARVDRI